MRRRGALGAGGLRRQLVRLLADAGANLQRSAELIFELLSSWPENEQIVDEITRCEQEGDRITHAIVAGLHRSRIAPVERKDIYALAGAIDDVVDDIEEGAQELAVYRIEAPMEQAQELAGVLRDAGRALSHALASLRQDENMDEDLARIRRLEQEGDRIYRQSLAALFDGGIDPMLIIRWKDVFAALEEAIDRCRAAANILQGMAIRRG